MDATDYAIYRRLSRDGLVRFWASRRIVDPRMSVREVADQVGLSEAGVRSRLAGLKSRGFLRGTEVSLNPSLFGASVVVAEIPIRNTGESGRLMHDLAVVDGVLFARDILDEADRKMLVYYVSDNPGGTARRTALLRRLSPSEAIRGPNPYWIPACTHALSPLDLRLVAEFRRNPDGTLAKHSAAAKVSLKTTARRHGVLLDSRACWWSHSSDSEEWPLALLQLTIAPGADGLAVAARVAEHVEVWLPVAPDGNGVNPERSPPSVAGLVPAERPAALERTLREILDLEGVANVRRTFGLGSRTYPQWTDEKLAPGVSRRAE